ncbi:MAG: DEAD/DEAH box helicase [Oscillospiraceae bacterium]|nr:DEAD/DEAH box helicase [Oscillospiraceae bacterium]
MTFRDLGLTAPILKALDEQGYKQPSPIQSKAIPPALVGRDVLGCAQTGTGKTCAFAAPILQRLNAKKAEGRPIRSLILTPTRELAIQIGESFDAYGRYLPLRTAVIFGGVGQAPQVEKLKKGVDILVATPGRLGDLYQQKLLDLSKIEIFVLDEADRMLDMGFIHDVKKILKWLPEKKQTLFFSATMPPEIIRLVDSLLYDPARVAVDPISSPVEVIRQSVYFVDRSNKTKLLAALVKELNARSALVFTRTKHGANKVARDLEKSGIPAAAIHGNKSQTARQQALANFKAGKIRCLVATDIAARGLDIEDLSHVFNYNLPDVPETYVHRIGRTGRAGKDGVAVALCDFSETPLLRDIEKLIGKAIPVIEGHPFPMENFEAPAKDKRGKIINAEDAEARQAARERSRQRREAAVPKVQAVSDPAVPEQEKEDAAPAKKKRRRKKKADAQPVTPVQTPASEYEPEPEPAALRPVKPKLTRPGTRFDTGDQMPVVDFDRPDPLAGDRIMDATARLLAPRRITVPAAPSKKEEPVRQENRSGRKKKKTPTPQPEKQPVRQSQSRPEKAKPKQKRQTKPEQKNKTEQPAKPQQGAAPRPGVKNPHQRRQRMPQLPERSGRTKDSTEQKSLMKPYYISHDD